MLIKKNNGIIILKWVVRSVLLEKRGFMLGQNEFKYLLEIKKRFKDKDSLDLTMPWSREVLAEDSKDKFILDYYRGRIKLTKFSYNKRYKTSIILARFCSEGRHTNPPPDSTSFNGPHVHVYREGFDDKIAFPISEIGIDDDDMDKAIVLEKYINWIKDNTRIRTIKEGKLCEISTPILDRHNDHIEIYILREGEDKYKLTDDSYTISDLAMSGMEMNTPKREQALRTILNGFGVSLDKKELFVIANSKDIAPKKHFLLQAILAVNDMHVLSQENVYSLFKEDVQMFFNANDIYYSKDVKISGRAGILHNIDFLINKTKTRPERLIKTVSKPKKDYLIPVMFAFNEIAEVREEKPKSFVIYNDSEQQAPEDLLYALRSYDIEAISWSNKERCLEEFSLN